MAGEGLLFLAFYFPRGFPVAPRPLPRQARPIENPGIERLWAPEEEEKEGGANNRSGSGGEAK